MRQDLIDYLRSQPEDFVVTWYADGMDSDRPWDETWVDVLFEDRLAWVISSGLDEDDEIGSDLIWPPDMVGHKLIDPAGMHPVATVIPTPLHGPVDPGTLEAIHQAWMDASDRAFWVGVPVWSATEINRAIEDWCMQHVGRVVQARWDADHGPSPTMVEACAQLEAMRTGLEPKYLLHTGEHEGGTGYSVYVSEQLMDEFLQAFADDDIS